MTRVHQYGGEIPRFFLLTNSRIFDIILKNAIIARLNREKEQFEQLGKENNANM